MEGSLVAYKVFSNGSVLNASEINDNLMRQSVIVFSNAAARSAAITVPLEGMLTWLEDVNDYQFYNGSAWTSLITNGLVHIKTQAIGTAVTTVTVNDAFSATYDNYKILINGTGAGSSDINVQLRLGSANTQYYAGRNSIVFSSGTVTTGADNNTTQWLVGARINPDFQSMSMELQSPFLAKNTTMSQNDLAAIQSGTSSGIQKSNTSFTAFTLNVFSGTMTGGSISVYGYRK